MQGFVLVFVKLNRVGIFSPKCGPYLDRLHVAGNSRGCSFRSQTKENGKQLVKSGHFLFYICTLACMGFVPENKLIRIRIPLCIA